MGRGCGSARRPRPASRRPLGLADADATTLCVKTLLEVVDAGAKNMEVVVLKRAADGAQTIETLPDDALSAIIAAVEAEREESKEESKMEE